MRGLISLILLFLTEFAIAQKTESFSLILKDPAGKNIEHANVHILNVENAKIESSKGIISIQNIPKGVYFVEISAFGFSNSFHEVDFTKHNSIEIELAYGFKKLDDVIITGDKKEASSNRTAGSFTSFNQKEIERLRLWSINDLSGLSPNFNLAQSGDNRNVAFIRGIGSTSYEQGVSTYIDGVSQFSLDTYIPQLNDIERIEILRGPQGTMYGRNSIGGIINIITKKVGSQKGLNAEINVGDHGQKRFSGSYRFPIIQNKLFASASVLSDVKDGFYYNDYTKSKFDKQNQSAFHFQLKYFLNSSWTAQLDQKLYGAKNNGAYPLVGDIGDLFSNPYHLSQDNVTSMHDKTSNSSLTIKHKGEKTDFLLQSAYQQNYRYYDNTIDADFSPYNIVGIYNNYGPTFNKVNAFTQELKWSSSELLQKKLNWTTGLYYYSQNSPNKQATVFGKDAGFIGVPDVNFSVISINHAQNSGLAGYGNVKWSLGEQLALNAGLRIDNEFRKMTSSSEYEKQPSPAFTTQEAISKSSSYIAASPKIGLQYNRSKSSIWYLNYSRGFRSGGITSISSDPSQVPLLNYQPEYSNNIEAGIRGDELNQRLRFGIAAFYTIVDHVQVPTLVLPDAITIIKNAGRLTSKGLEFELSAIPVNGIVFSYNGGLTNAKYSSYITGQNGNIVNLSGKRQIFTPLTTNFISLQYQHLLTEKSKYSFVLRGEYKQFGKQYFDIANTIEQKQYGLLNFRTGLESEKFGVYIWVRNALDQKYIEYAYDFGAAHLGNPKTMGLTIKLNLIK